MEQKELRSQLEHMFACAWQDGVHHLNPKYLRRDRVFTEKAMELFGSYAKTMAANKLEKTVLKLSIETDCEVCMENQEILNAELQSNKGMEE